MRDQYLRIKALAIATAGNDSAAILLFQRVLREYPDSLSARMALEHIGDLARKAGDSEAAERSYRELLARWPDLNATSHMAEVSLAELLLDRGDDGDATEALSLLKSAIERGVTLNVNLFRWHLALIRAADAIGDPQTAKKAAETVMQLAGRGPQFARHPDVGVVRADPATLAWLEQRAT